VTEADVSQANGDYPALVDATDAQERRFARAFALLDGAIARKAFPGAALAVTHGGQLLALRAFGRFTYDAASPEVLRETAWDLASLTKPIAAASMAMLLHERRCYSLDSAVVTFLQEFASAADPRREQVTVRMLLEHSSGLPAHRKLYLEATGREAMVAAAMRVPLDSAPGARYEYSDIGFILLGELLERLAGERIDVFCQREVFAPLKLNFYFSPYCPDLKKIPPTGTDTEYRHRIIQGEVGDENASAMGGIAAHAGLFGDALSVARYAECFLRGGSPIFQAETVQLFTTRATRPAGSSRTPGWDTPSTPSQSGTRFSPRSFGHLGYTGTSLWCDPERGLSVTLLSNRTWPDATNQAIKEVRPLVHDAIVEAIECVKS
jgi:CubicO group peptidase (beta-lactamase class C family)